MPERADFVERTIGAPSLNSVLVTCQAVAALALNLVALPQAAQPSHYDKVLNKLRGKVFADTKGLAPVVALVNNRPNYGWGQEKTLKFVNQNGQWQDATEVRPAADDEMVRWSYNVRSILAPYLSKRSSQPKVRGSWDGNYDERFLIQKVAQSLRMDAVLKYFEKDYPGSLSSFKRLKENLPLLKTLSAGVRVLAKHELDQLEEGIVALQLRLSHKDTLPMLKQISAATTENAKQLMNSLAFHEYHFSELPLDFRDQDTDLLVESVLNDLRWTRNFGVPVWITSYYMLQRYDPSLVIELSDWTKARSFLRTTWQLRPGEAGEDRWMRVFLAHTKSPELQAEMVLSLTGAGLWIRASDSRYLHMEAKVREKFGERVMAILHNNLARWRGREQSFSSQLRETMALLIWNPDLGSDESSRFLQDMDKGDLNHAPVSSMIVRLVKSGHPSGLAIQQRIVDECRVSLEHANTFLETRDTPAMAALAEKYFNKQPLDFVVAGQLFMNRTLAIPAFRKRLILELDSRDPLTVAIRQNSGTTYFAAADVNPDGREFSMADVFARIIALCPKAPRYNMNDSVAGRGLQREAMKVWLRRTDINWTELGKELEKIGPPAHIVE